MGVQQTFPPGDAILVAAEVAYYLCRAAERGEWQLAPEKLEYLVAELGTACIGPEGKLPQEMVRDYIEAVRELAESDDDA